MTAGPVPVRIAVTPGDPRGVGPELLGRALPRFLEEEHGGVQVTVVGPPGLVDAGLPQRPVARWDGTPAGAGAVALDSIRVAVAEAISGSVDAIVTGPVHKPELRRAGADTPGQTELLRDLSGVGEVGMLMAADRTALGGPLRVLLATTHLPLRDVPVALTTLRLVSQTILLDRSLRRDWGLSEPRIALCALNPHASDGGLFGEEEETVYGPALALLSESGIAADGPLPADTVFSRAASGEFDAVVAPYHDVGMAAFKTVSFGSGVNVTLGLPFVRTSPDHGTAFKIAGLGVANESSTLEALRVASRLARARRATDRHVRPSDQGPAL